jgi:hypothetical protein
MTVNNQGGVGEAQLKDGRSDHDERHPSGA